MSVVLIQIFIFVIESRAAILPMSDFFKKKISKRSTKFS